MKRCTNILDVIPHLIKHFEDKKEIKQRELELVMMLLTGWKRNVCINWIREMVFMGYLKIEKSHCFVICNGKPGKFRKKNQKKLELEK